MSTPIKWGGEIPVNTTTLSSQDQPERMALANGRFVVMWRDISASGGDTNGQAVRGQMPNTDGSKFGRDPSYQFDTQKYLAANPGVTTAHINPLEHFLLFDAIEGRAAITGGWL